MKCHDIENLMAQHVFGELDAAEARAVSAHLAGCPACSELAAEFRQTADLLREGAAARAPAGFSPERKQALLVALSRPAPHRRGRVLGTLAGAKDFAAQPWVLRIAATLLVCALLAGALLPGLFRHRDDAHRHVPDWARAAPAEREVLDKDRDVLSEEADEEVREFAVRERATALRDEPAPEAPPPRLDKPAPDEEERVIAERRAPALADEPVRLRPEHTLPVEPPPPSAPMRTAPSRRMMMQEAAPLEEAPEAATEPPVPWAEPAAPEKARDIVAQQQLAAAKAVRDVRPFAVLRLPGSTASYHAAREAIMGGQLPPKDSIRPGEFVNAFDYGYPAERGARAFGGYMLRAQAAASPFAEGKALVKVAVHPAEEREGGERASLERLRLSLTFHPGRVARFRTAGHSPASEAPGAALRRSAAEGLEAAGLVPKPEGTAPGTAPRRNERAFAALFEVELVQDPVEGTPERLGFAYLSYKAGRGGRGGGLAMSHPLPLPQTPPPGPEEAPRFHWAACAAEFARILREEAPPAPESLERVRGVMEQVAAALPESEAGELLDLIRRAEALQP